MAAPSEKYDSDIDALAAEFGAVAAAIESALAAATAATVSAAYLATLRYAIAYELGLLLRASALWVSLHVPRIYGDGAGGPTGPLEEPPSEATPVETPSAETPDVADVVQGAVQHPEQERDVVQNAAHTEAVQAASEELMLALQHAINGIGVSANARLEDIRRRNIARALAQDAPLANALDQQLAADMERAGIAFTDRSGRQWDGEAYARMVLRTHVATTLNVGAVHRAIAGGSRYVRVFDGGPGDVDEPCRIANGQIWHVAIAAANLLEHPNCRRAFAPLDPSYSGPVDRDIREMVAA